MTVVYSTDTDVGALPLDGTVGSLAAILSTILVSAGWTVAFSAGNVVVFRQAVAADAALRAYYRLNDNGPGAHGGREARILAYEAMSDIDTGVRPCPLVSQAANGLFVRKSATADATTRPYRILADGRTCKMWMTTGDSAGRWGYWAFGDYYSFKLPHDSYRQFLHARITEASAGITSTVDTGNVLSQDVAQVLNGFYLIRSVTAEVGAVEGSLIGHGGLSRTLASNTWGVRYGKMAYKNAGDQYVYTPPLIVGEPGAGNAVRGLMRGEFYFGHPQNALGDGSLITGVQDLAGKQLMVIYRGGDDGVWVTELSNTWVTNS